MNTEVKNIVSCLQEGGVVVLPTDTVYGLAVNPNFPEAVDRLYAIKQRPRQLSLPVMVADMESLYALGIAVNEAAQALLESEFVPGALTLAVGFRDKPLVSWLAGREEIAVRIPDDERLLAVLKEGGPLFVTSANASGQDTPSTLPEILAQLHIKPDLAIDGGRIETIPSTLVNCRLNPPVIEREGVIPAAALTKILEI